MDDDIKNLFHVYGRSGLAYREFNRQAESDSVVQRWPLLRDVRIIPYTASALSTASVTVTPAMFVDVADKQNSGTKQPESLEQLTNMVSPDSASHQGESKL
jgi:hypothetical protein